MSANTATPNSPAGAGSSPSPLFGMPLDIAAAPKDAHTKPKVKTTKTVFKGSDVTTPLPGGFMRIVIGEITLETIETPKRRRAKA